MKHLLATVLGILFVIIAFSSIYFLIHGWPQQVQNSSLIPTISDSDTIITEDCSQLENPTSDIKISGNMISSDSFKFSLAAPQNWAIQDAIDDSSSVYLTNKKSELDFLLIIDKIKDSCYSNEKKEFDSFKSNENVLNFIKKVTHPGLLPDGKFGETTLKEGQFKLVGTKSYANIDYSYFEYSISYPQKNGALTFYENSIYLLRPDNHMYVLDFESQSNPISTDSVNEIVSNLKFK